MVDSSPDKRGEADFLRQLRDVLAPLGSAASRNGEQDAALDAINDRLATLNTSAASHARQLGGVDWSNPELTAARDGAGYVNSAVGAINATTGRGVATGAAACAPSTTPRSQTIEEAKAVAMKATLCAQIMLQNPVVVANEKARHICVDTRDAANAFLAANPE